FAANPHYICASGTIHDILSFPTRRSSDLGINITPYDVVYNGAAHTATGTVTGAAGEDLSSLLDLSGTTHTNVGDYTADAWSFARTEDHTSALQSRRDIVSRPTLEIKQAGI